RPVTWTSASHGSGPWSPPSTPSWPGAAQGMNARPVRPARTAAAGPPARRRPGRQTPGPPARRRPGLLDADDLDVDRGADLRVQPHRHLVRAHRLDRVGDLDPAPVELGSPGG